MKKTLCFLLSLIIIIFSFSTLALSTYITDFPESLEIGETPKELSFNIHNDSSVKRQVSIDYFLPGKYFVLESKDYLLPNEIGKYSIRIFPEEALEGKTYVAALTIDVEGDIFEKEFFVNYFSEDACTISLDKNLVKENGLELIAKNLSYKRKQLDLIRTTNFESKLKSFEFLPFEEKKLLIEFSEKPKPNADLIAEFSCKDKKLVVKATYLDQNIQTLFSGLFVLPNIDFGILLNIFLAFLAALLLLVFVARFTKLVVKK
ncbi:MAG: hypothetical protein QXU92_00545 [Candidatus Diapherotrites archaeon]